MNQSTKEVMIVARNARGMLRGVQCLVMAATKSDLNLSAWGWWQRRRWSKASGWFVVQ